MGTWATSLYGNEIEIIGRLAVDAELVKRELNVDSPAIARWGDAKSLANIAASGPYSRLVEVADPVGRYLRPGA